MVGGLGVTTEHDRQLLYRKKSMPRGKKKKWQAFKRKVKAVAEKELGSRTVLFNKSVSGTNNISTKHGIAFVQLYGAKSTQSQNNDLDQIYQNENILDPTALRGETIDPTTKFIFQSAVLDITVRNVSYLSSTPTVVADFLTLEVDIYEITINHYANDPATTFNSIQDYFSTSSADSKDIGGTGTGIEVDFRGATPWEIPHALSQFKMKILKKTKYFLTGGRTLTYQYRDPKRRVISRSRMQRLSGCNMPGWTHHVMMIFKAVPGIAIDATTGYTEKLEIGTTRKYLYNITGMNDTRDRYFANT
jgi:hypothetical protein